METTSIDGMDEHDFRHSVEDMLRFGQVDEAIERLRVLLEPYAGAGGILPSRFLEVTSACVEFAGWHRLADRLRNYDRRGHPISAIGVVLADARTLGGPGPSGGWLPPFIKTYYFSDDAYPFSDATRDDLLDGYSREGFGWQSDYQATDATLSIKGIDDLYGAIVTLEDRLLDAANPADDEVRAGSIGACYLAALIHQSLRETIRRKGLPRPLCVLAACDGVYPFFDAPVAGHDEWTAEELAETAPEEVWPNELEEASLEDEDELEEELPGEASLLTVASRKGTKKAVIVLGEEDAREATRFTEMASAQRMIVDDDTALKGLFQGVPAAELAEADWFGDWDEPEDAPIDTAGSGREPLPGSDWQGDLPPGPAAFPGMAPDPSASGGQGLGDEDGWDDAGIYSLSDVPEPDPDQPVDSPEADPRPAEMPFTPPPRHSLRSRFNLAPAEAKGVDRGRVRAVVDWLRRALLRR